MKTPNNIEIVTPFELFNEINNKHFSKSFHNEKHRARTARVITGILDRFNDGLQKQINDVWGWVLYYKTSHGELADTYVEVLRYLRLVQHFSMNQSDLLKDAAKLGKEEEEKEMDRVIENLQKRINLK